MDWSVVTGIIALVALIISFFQWHVNQNYKRMTNQHSELEARVQTLERDIDKCHSNAQQTRDELHKEYVHMSMLGELKRDNDKNFQDLFAKLSGLSRVLHQAVGELRASRRFHGGYEPHREDDLG